MISDHHRWDYLGAMDQVLVQTPSLDGLAQRGTLLTGMHSTTPLCVPQRIAISSGRYPMNSHRYTNRQAVDPSMPTFLQSLRRAGVQTAMIGKFHHHVHTYDADFLSHEPDVHQLGYDYVHETSGKQGVGTVGCECQYSMYLRRLGILKQFREWTGRWDQIPPKSKPNESWPWEWDTTQDAYIGKRGCEFLQGVRRDRPFFLHLGFVGPHPPFDAPDRYREAYASIDPPAANDGSLRDVDSWRAYSACISEVDFWVGEVLRTLQSQGLDDETAVFYTSDHGDEAGDHGRWGKGTFYEGSVRVPFLAAGPGIPRKRRVEALAELIDLGRTVCDLFGCDSHDLDQGVSLVRVLQGSRADHRPDVFAEMGSDKMLFDGRYKVMYCNLTKDRRTQLQEPPINGPAFGRSVNLPPDIISVYDLVADPSERNDLAEDPAHAELVDRLRERLLNRIIVSMQSARESPGSVL